MKRSLQTLTWRNISWPLREPPSSSEKGWLFKNSIWISTITHTETYIFGEPLGHIHKMLLCTHVYSGTHEPIKWSRPKLGNELPRLAQAYQFVQSKKKLMWMHISSTESLLLYTFPSSQYWNHCSLLTISATIKVMTLNDKRMSINL